MLTFYNRHDELALVRETSNNLAKTQGRLTTVVGRRRVGKTAMLREAFANTHYLYLFVSKKKSEQDLVAEFFDIIQHSLNLKVFGQPRSIIELLKLLFEYAKQQPLTVVIDEFQDFLKVNPTIFADLQNLWDSHKNTSMIHLLCCGSIYSLMTKLFQDEDESLFGRATGRIDLQPLTPSYLKQILIDQSGYSAEKLLQLYAFSGGIPKYVEDFLEAGERPWERLISGNSLVIKEGEYRLVEDFGGERKHYFSILAGIAEGHNTRPKLESLLGATSLNVPLKELDETFGVIQREVPVTSKGFEKQVRYSIKDPFLVFWFSFINKYSSAVQIGNFDFIRTIIERDYNTFSGRPLEALFHQILAESKQFNRIGRYWGKTENIDEIDIVAIDELNNKILVAEVKRNSAKYKASTLREKASRMFPKLPNFGKYEVEYLCLSLNNLDQIMERFAPIKHKR